VGKKNAKILFENIFKIKALALGGQIFFHQKKLSTSIVFSLSLIFTVRSVSHSDRQLLLPYLAKAYKFYTLGGELINFWEPLTTQLLFEKDWTGNPETKYVKNVPLFSLRSYRVARFFVVQGTKTGKHISNNHNI
jgi:hypothetical protein